MFGRATITLGIGQHSSSSWHCLCHIISYISHYLLLYCKFHMFIVNVRARQRGVFVFWKTYKHLAYDLPLLKQWFVGCCCSGRAGSDAITSAHPGRNIGTASRVGTSHRHGWWAEWDGHWRHGSWWSHVARQAYNRWMNIHRVSKKRPTFGLL